MSSLNSATNTAAAYKGALSAKMDKSSLQQLLKLILHPSKAEFVKEWNRKELAKFFKIDDPHLKTVEDLERLAKFLLKAELTRADPVIGLAYGTYEAECRPSSSISAQTAFISKTMLEIQMNNLRISFLNATYALLDEVFSTIEEKSRFAVALAGLMCRF
jgi:hypothetical protein